MSDYFLRPDCKYDVKFVLADKSGYTMRIWLDPDKANEFYYVIGSNWPKDRCSKLKIENDNLYFAHNADYNSWKNWPLEEYDLDEEDEDYLRVMFLCVELSSIIDKILLGEDF